MTQTPETLDLNLLAKLDALLDECHVSKAAARVGITQSAMSRSLAQLREVFGDELLVRGRGGLELTARGAELKARVRVALEHVDAVMRDRPSFEPKTAQRTFIIASADYAEALLLSDVVQRLVAESPASDIIVRTAARPPNVMFAASLENPEVDLVIGPRVKAPAGVVWTPLFRERFVCVVAQGDGRVGSRMTLKTFLSLPHVAVAPGGTRGSLVDDLLESRGVARRVALRVPTFLLAAYMVSQGDLIGVYPERLARKLAGRFGLRVLKTPIEFAGFDLCMGWHERYRGDAAHAWMRGLIKDAVAALDGGAEPGTA